MTHKRQSGAALVVALFLLVVLAALAAVTVRMTSVQQQTVNLALLSQRAMLAARSGIQWGAHQALNAGVCAPATLTLSEAALAGFDVAVNCSSTSHAEGGATTTVYRIDAFAQAGVYGRPDYVSRRIAAAFSRTL